MQRKSLKEEKIWNFDTWSTNKYINGQKSRSSKQWLAEIPWKRLHYNLKCPQSVFSMSI